VRLRVDRFELMTRVIGKTTITGRAELIGVDRKTLRRVLHGGITPGEVFIGKTVAALRRHADTLAECGLSPSLDELFEVVEEPDLAEAVA
jgi:hypothetical protein